MKPQTDNGIVIIALVIVLVLCVLAVLASQ